VIVPVFKTGGRHLRCRRCVRLTHASATTYLGFSQGKVRAHYSGVV